MTMGHRAGGGVNAQEPLQGTFGPAPGLSHVSRLDERLGLASGCSFVSAENATLIIELPDGSHRECVDFTSAFGSVNFGHRNPAVEQRVQAGSDVVGFCYPREADDLARWLCIHFGSGLDDRVLFQVGGSFAVSAALALAQRARPGRVVAIGGGFHGLGCDSQAITSIQRSSALQWTEWIEPLANQVVVLEPGATIDDWKGISCVIYEPVQGANGYVPLSAEWLSQLERAAQSSGVITIADQIQAGFFRHGVLSMAHAMGLQPDISLCSKSLTNGMYPLSAVIYPAALEPNLWQPFLAHTFQTGTLGYAAGLAVSAYIDDTPLTEMASDVEDALEGFASEHLRDDALGLAVAQATHVTGPTLSFEPHKPAREVIRAAFAEGILLCAGGPVFERIRVAPPLTIRREQLHHGLAVLAHVLTESSSGVLAGVSAPGRMRTSGG